MYKMCLLFFTVEFELNIPPFFLVYYEKLN